MNLRILRAICDSLQRRSIRRKKIRELKFELWKAKGVYERYKHKLHEYSQHYHCDYWSSAIHRCYVDDVIRHEKRYLKLKEELEELKKKKRSEFSFLENENMEDYGRKQY